MKNLISLLAALAISLSLPAFAAHDGMQGNHCERMGKKGGATATMPADVDNDGSVDWEEAHNAFIKHFDEMDANQDGLLTPDETKDCCCMSGNHCKQEGKCKDGKCKRHAGMHDKGSKQFDAADKDKDGTLDRKEAKKLKNVYKNFDAIDGDKDGTVDRDEVHNFMSGH